MANRDSMFYTGLSLGIVGLIFILLIPIIPFGGSMVTLGVAVSCAAFVCRRN